MNHFYHLYIFINKNNILMMYKKEKKTEKDIYWNMLVFPVSMCNLI